MQNREVLDIIDLIYYFPAFGLAIWICIKHGLGRQLGWIYLVILSLMRIIAGATGIANANNPSSGLTEASAIAYSVGLAPLILALMGMLKRVNEGMTRNQFSPRFLQLLSLPTLVGLAVGIAGGVDLYSNNPDNQSDGIDLVKASSILFLVVFLVLVVVTIWTIIFARSVQDGERRLVFASALSIPFFIVRIIYTLLSAFDRNPKYFSLVSTSSSAVIVQGCMSLLMEFIIVAIILLAGFLVAPIPRGSVRPGY